MKFLNYFCLCAFVELRFILSYAIVSISSHPCWCCCFLQYSSYFAQTFRHCAFRLIYAHILLTFFRIIFLFFSFDFSICLHFVVVVVVVVRSVQFHSNNLPLIFESIFIMCNIFKCPRYLCRYECVK